LNGQRLHIAELPVAVGGRKMGSDEWVEWRKGWMDMIHPLDAWM
jgi:hypothetical protein